MATTMSARAYGRMSSGTQVAGPGARAGWAVAGDAGGMGGAPGVRL